jgi:aminoglycoside phosphotransferase family enzyme
MRDNTPFPERLANTQDGILAFLSDPASYPGHPGRVEAIETHMSRVFLAGDRVYKIKKPMRFPFVDFSTLEERRRNCQRELELNQDLAPGVYLAVLPLAREADGGLSLGGSGEVIEWVLMMHRLDRDLLLDRALPSGAAHEHHADKLAAIMARFYARTPRIGIDGRALLSWWDEAVSLTEGSLSNPVLSLPQEMVRKPIEFLRRFLLDHGDAIAARAPCILDGHGDLRPEHVHLGPPIRLIDRLEFDPRLRWVDPFDEASFLGLESERLGAAWFGPRLVDRLRSLLGYDPSADLLRFYRCYRACMRARLSIEHMLDPAPRTPERWPAQAKQYLGLALL